MRVRSLLTLAALAAGSVAIARQLGGSPWARLSGGSGPGRIDATKPTVLRDAWYDGSNLGVRELRASDVARSQHEQPMRRSEETVDTAFLAHREPHQVRSTSE